jgi:hypothetical protein
LVDAAAKLESQDSLADGRAAASRRFQLRHEWAFAAMLAAYGVIYLAWYPATYTISDEGDYIALARALWHGTIFVDRAGGFWGLPVGNHMVSKYSVFHSALLAPAFALDWRLMFIVSASFFVWGAFISRKILRGHGLGSGWCLLYFMLAGGLYYSQTVMAAVPSAVMGLAGVSLCLRERPRPLLAGLAFGASILLHPWTGPLVAMFGLVFSLEQGRAAIRAAASLAIGVAPAAFAIMAYNAATTGSPFRDVYTILGSQYEFTGERLPGFFYFYALSFAIFPIAGWSALWRRFSGTWAIPVTCVLGVAMCSLYFFRDGLRTGSARIGPLAFIAGAIPGQRFLLPVSMIACLPAARFLSTIASRIPARLQRAARMAAVASFAIFFAALSLTHASYIGAHAALQRALAERLPPDAPIGVSGEAVKEFAPTDRLYSRLDYFDDDAAVPSDHYFVCVRLPGDVPPPAWMRGHRATMLKFRSWAWNRDLWIGMPSAPSQDAPRRSSRALREE